MSTLKTNTVQLGNSADPTKNFTLKVPATPDGTLEVWSGNAESPISMVSKVDANGIQNVDSAHKLYTPQNIVGTMAGGSIFESGSNENGGYVKFVDGSMQCHAGLMYESTAGGFMLWNYPSAFEDIPTVTGVASQSTAPDARFLVLQSNYLTKTQVGYARVNGSGAIQTATGTFTCFLHAIGRWK